MSGFLALIQYNIVGGAILGAAVLFTLAEIGIDYVRDRSHRRQLEIAITYIVGCLAGGFFGWKLIPPAEWNLSFWTTVHASIDAQAYSHLVEHTAEDILIGVTSLGVITGSIFATADLVAARLANRLRHI